MQPARALRALAWGLLLVLAPLACSAQVITAANASQVLLRHEEPAPEGTVQVLAYAPGFEKARTDADMAQLYSDNLGPDLKPFQKRGGWSIDSFADFVKVFNEQVPRHELGEGNAGLVVIRNGTVRVHWLRGKDNHWRFACIKSAVESAKSLNFPDTAFIVNIDDFPICKDDRCPLPVFTNYKKWRGGKNLETNEVLFPVFNHHYEDLYVFPWEKKRGKAMMRASQQGCMAANSSRAVLAVTSEYHPKLLDLGITRIDGLDKHFLKYRFSKAGFVTIPDHAKWRYLVSADGCVAQTRLVKVMLSNSVVVKEESDWIEYYYRSLKPWQHYAPFRAGPDAGEQVISIVEHLEQNQDKAQQIADTAQHWAYRYLSQYPRLLYFRQLLTEYNKLFNGHMERWVLEGGPEVLVGQALEISKRRASRLAAAHHHLRRVARKNAMRLQQLQQQQGSGVGTAAGGGGGGVGGPWFLGRHSSSSSGSSGSSSSSSSSNSKHNS